MNRGVDKRSIFLDDQDRFRFIHDLYEFNNQDWVSTTFRDFNRMNDIASRTTKHDSRKLLVDVHMFCLMSNHYHLLLSPRVENGVSRFMKKLNMGYAKYFNQKYQRRGALFEGRYKAVLVKKEKHFIHLPFYIHLNPLDLITPEWRQGRISNLDKAVKFLENYRWSSFLDYCGKDNFPSITMRKFILGFFGGTNNYRRNIKEWLAEMDLSNINDVVLE